MNRIIFSTRRSPSALATSERLAQEGHEVWIWDELTKSEQQSLLDGRIDILVLSLPQSDCKEGSFGVGEGLQYEIMLQNLEQNTQPLLDLVKKVTPSLAQSCKKRIVYLTRKADSVRESKDSDSFGIHMAAAANHMMMKVLFNTLRPQGFTFRVFAWEPGDPGIPAWKYILRDQSYISIDPCCHSEENRLVMKDGMLSEIPW